MARRTKSLKYGTVLHDGEGYGHRDHRSSKSRVRGYNKKRTRRIILAEREAKRERKFVKRGWHNW